MSVMASDQETSNIVRLLGKAEGLGVGISFGTNVVVALKIKYNLSPGKRIVTILWDIGERYISMK